MFSILLEIARGILYSLICVVHFYDNFDNVFHNKIFMKLIEVPAVLRAKKKERIGCLEYSILTIHFRLSIISTPQFYLKVKAIK